MRPLTETEFWEKRYAIKEWFHDPISEHMRGDHDDPHCLNTHSSVALVVDLSVPDSVLVEAFKIFLSTTRKKFGVTKEIERVRGGMFENWTRLGILPFIDLYLWSLEAHETISNRVMADAIFAVGEGGEETVRKSTKPIALKLLNTKTDQLTTLMAQAALGMNDQNPFEP